MKSMKLQSVCTIKYRVVYLFILFILLNKVVWWVDVKSLMRLMPMGYITINFGDMGLIK